MNHMWTISMLQMHEKPIIIIDEDSASDLQVKNI